MDDMDFPTPDVDIESVTPDELKGRIDAGETITLLDARMKSDYEEWRGTSPSRLHSKAVEGVDFEKS